MTDFVSKSGWKKISNVLTANECMDLISSFEGNRTENNKVYELSSKEWRLPKVANCIRRFREEISLETTYRNVELSKIWYVSTTFENSEPGKLPYIPHFDKRRFVKLMVYLTDVTGEDGPFTTADHDVSVYEDQRMCLPEDYKELGLNSKLHDHNFQEILATAGDGIIFDTNCAHYAKPVGENGRRHVLRFDFEDYDWNKHQHSLGARFLRLFK